MEKIQRKSLSLGQAFPAISAVALVAIVIVVIIYMFTSLQTGVGSTESKTMVNATGTINATGYLLVNSTECNFASPSITGVYNTSGILVSPGNYSLSGTYYLTNLTNNNMTNAIINYTYYNGGTACTATANASNQFSGIVPMVGLILVIVLIGVVIGVLINSFVGGKIKA